MKFRKKTLSILIALIVGVLSIKHFYHKSSKEPMDAPVTVDVEKVRKGTVVQETHTIGTLVAAKNIQVSPEVSGVVSKVFFDDGGIFVAKGAPLVQLDDAALKAKLIADEANYNYSQMDYKRKALLGKHGAISQGMIDQAYADLKTKEAIVAETRVSVDHMLLTAPFDGEIGKINVSPGDYVNAGQKIVSLTDIQHLHVDYSIPEKYLSEIHLGQPIQFTTSAYPGMQFEGKVTYISPTIDMQARTIDVYAEVLNTEKRLTAGLFVNLTHHFGETKEALLVSSSSLVATIDGQSLFKVVDGKAVSTPVQIGERFDNTVQIVAGAALGDVIVVAGQDKLKNGTPVKIQNAG